MDVFDSLTDLLGGGSEGFRRSTGAGILDYLKDVVSGKVASEGVLAQSHYDPNRSFAQNALDPAAIEQATDVAFGVGPGAIRAYHGSPHSFDRFDLSKIGTGEGAQAYGHGLYFAENEGVARGYRDDLGAGQAFNALDDFLKSNKGASLQAEDIAARLVGTRAEALAQDPQAIKAMRELLPNYDPSGAVSAGDLRNYRYLNDTVERLLPGHMYEVDIHADPKAFLDWDKPLGVQADVRNTIDPMIEHYAVAHSGKADPTGQQIYDAVRGLAGSEYPGATKGYMPPPGFNVASLASRQLREAGIPGIRYLDQGSRVTGDPVKLQQQIDFARRFADDTDLLPRDRIGWQQRVAELESDLAHAKANPPTSNYAVFDDSIIEILRKYGIVPPLAAGATGAGLLGGEEPY